MLKNSFQTADTIATKTCRPYEKIRAHVAQSWHGIFQLNQCNEEDFTSKWFLILISIVDNSIFIVCPTAMVYFHKTVPAAELGSVPLAFLSPLMHSSSV